MGLEARCLARIGERIVEVKAQLESDEIVLRGEHRARLPLASLESVEAADGWLSLRQGGETIGLELGPAAERWAGKIRNPPTLLDKLGVKAGQEVAAVGVTDSDLLAALRACVDLIETFPFDLSTVAHDIEGAELDIVFVEVETDLDLDLLPIAAQAIVQDGAVWAIHPKRRPDLTDTDVRAAGKRAGLVDNKTARISETHTALRFVIPKASRQPTRRPRET